MKKKWLKHKKLIAIILSCFVGICCFITLVHFNTLQFYEEADYEITATKIDRKSDIWPKDKYYIYLSGEETPVECTKYEYLYIENPRMYSDDTETEYVYNIRYKKSIFPLKKAKVVIIKDRLPKGFFDQD